MNKGWRYESARHALAAQGVKTGRRYNFDPAAFQESIRGLGFGRQIVRPEMMQRYTGALGPASRGVVAVAAPVAVQGAVVAAPTVVKVPVVTQVATRVGRNTVMVPTTSYKDVVVPAPAFTKLRVGPVRQVNVPMEFVPQRTAGAVVGVSKVSTPEEFWGRVRMRAYGKRM